MSMAGEPTPIYAIRGKGGLPGRSESNWDGARASSVKRKLRTESFCGAKKSANTVYES
jgi:hypothetical protein